MIALLFMAISYHGGKDSVTSLNVFDFSGHGYFARQSLTKFLDPDSSVLTTVKT